MRDKLMLILGLIVGVCLLAWLLWPANPPMAAAAPASSEPTPTATPAEPGKPPPSPQAERRTQQQIDEGKPGGTSACQTPIASPGVQGVIPLSLTPTGICSNAGFDVYQHNGRTYAVITGRYEAAFTLLDVTDPAHPQIASTYYWRNAQGQTTPTQYTYTQEARHFKQGPRQFVALNQEAFGNTNGFCGVAIVEVTDPVSPAFVTRLRGAPVAQGGWCDVHNTFIEPDAAGDGAYLYLTADEPDDLRVLDIRNLADVKEVGQYKEFGSTYIHDITVVDGRVYVSYWEAGLVILDTASLKPGIQPAPLNPRGSIKPAGFRVHHAWPTPDGGFVFIQDEIGSGNAFQAVRLYDIRYLSSPRQVASLGIPYRQAHNLHLADGRLYVGWYEAGLRGWDIDLSNPDAPMLTPVAQRNLRAGASGGYHGAWGVESLPCNVAGIPRTCLYTADMEMGLDIVLVQPEGFARADLNLDGRVNSVDLNHVAARWRARAGQSDYYALFDLNGDGEVNVLDIQAVIQQWTG